MRVLITGGTGFIGRHLVPLLLAHNHEVCLLVKETYTAGKLLPPPLQLARPHLHLVYADLRNFSLTVRAVREAQPEIAIHLAAVGTTDPFISVETALRHNVTGTIHLLRALFEKTNDCRQCLIARTPGERTTMNPYAASKAAAWQFCQMYSRTHQWLIHGAMIFQAYGLYQPPQTLIPAAMQAAQQGADFPLTSGTQQRDWIAANDVADGLRQAMDKQLDAGITFDLGTGRLHTVAQVVQEIYRIAGSSGQPQIGALPDRPGETTIQVADAGKTHALIGWRPPTTLVAGLEALYTHQYS